MQPLPGAESSAEPSAVATIADADAAIAELRTTLAIVETELVVHTADDHLGETVADGFQYALKVEFGRVFPHLSRLYDLHTAIVQRRDGSKIYTVRAAPSLKKEFRHLARELREARHVLAQLREEAQAARAVAADAGQAGAKPDGEPGRLRTIVLALAAASALAGPLNAALNGALDTGIKLHDFAQKWGLVEERAQRRIEQDHPATMVEVRRIDVSAPPAEAAGQPRSGSFDL